MLYCNVWCINPWGYTIFFGRRWGLYTRGLHSKIFTMHFYAPNAFPGLYERRNERLQKKLFLAAKNGVYTPDIRHYSTQILLTSERSFIKKINKFYISPETCTRLYRNPFLVFDPKARPLQASVDNLIKQFRVVVNMGNSDRLNPPAVG